MTKDFTVTIQDPERAAEWQQVLGTTTLYVTSPIPQLASLPGKPQAAVYYLDLTLLTQEQRDKLIEHLAAKFNIPTDYVTENLDHYGMPILANHCSVSIRNPQKWI